MHYLIRTSLIICTFLFAATTHAQLLENGGFESLTDGDFPEATGWTYQNTGAKITKDAHSGKHAMTLNTWYNWAPGTLDYDKPLAAKPSHLKGWYKYELGDVMPHQDSAVCTIQVFSGENTVADVRHALPPVKDYTQFTIPIPCNTDYAKVDRIAIHFLSAEFGKCAEGSGGNCLYFTLDDLELVRAEK
jgi:hypothetical protein